VPGVGSPAKRPGEPAASATNVARHPRRPVDRATPSVRRSPAVATQLPPGTADAAAISPRELALATRNHGMPLEALAYDLTPAGLHYLLVHYDVPVVDAAAWRLEVDGAVRAPLSLSLEDLRARPTASLDVTFECAGNGRSLLDPRPVSQPWGLEAIGTARWTGTSLARLLDEAGIERRAVEVAFTGLDRGVEDGAAQAYQRSLALGDALGDDLLLAWAMNGAPLPPQHGFPLRLVVPGWYGMTNVKWLSRITVLDEPFTGYQNARAYRLRRDADDEGVPVSRMAVRALMLPPGIPDFATRRRFVELGSHTLEGRAWSGAGPVERVEVSGDGGATWDAAELEPPPGPYAWQRWTAAWRPPARGDVELLCRATDASGATQPLEPPWNLGGYANNAVQRIHVTIT
jgi:DMSO/TMAO reductase YedYZ molybdopterin-dependent catalytic subunit